MNSQFKTIEELIKDRSTKEVKNIVDSKARGLAEFISECGLACNFSSLKGPNGGSLSCQQALSVLKDDMKTLLLPRAISANNEKLISTALDNSGDETN